jgi:hypothetical protein
MNTALPQRAKNYLIESLNKHSTGDLHEEFLREFGMNPGIAVDAYNKTKSPKSKNKGFMDSLYDTIDSGNEDRDKKRIENQKAIRKRGTKGSGFGRGGNQGEKGEGSSDDADLDLDKVLFGKTKPSDDELGIGTATGAYALGTGLDIAGQFLGNSILNKVPVLGKAAGAVSSLLGQAADISGSSWFDANIGKIGQNAQSLATQGAGSPWVPLAISKRGPFKPDAPTDPLASRKQAVAQRKLEDQEKKFGITP